MDFLAQKLHMGGYGGYVWPSFLIAAVILLGMVIASLRSLRRAQRSLAALLASQRNEA